MTQKEAKHDYIVDIGYEGPADCTLVLIRRSRASHPTHQVKEYMIESAAWRIIGATAPGPKPEVVRGYGAIVFETVWNHMDRDTVKPHDPETS